MAFKLMRIRPFTFSNGLVSTENIKPEQLMTSKTWIFCQPLLPAALSMKGFHTSPLSNIDHRKKRAVVRHLNYINHEKTLKHRHNPLVNLPDYTYCDGRPTEIMLSHKEREEKNHQLTERVVQLIDEMKFAQNQLKEQEKVKQNHIRHRQESRLKPKEQHTT